MNSFQIGSFEVKSSAPTSGSFLFQMRAGAVLLALAAALVVAGCDSGGGMTEDSPPDDPPEAQNSPPTAAIDISPSSDVEVGTEVTLDGTGSSDPDGDNLSYQWSLEAPGGSEASVQSPEAAQTTFTADVEGSYTATLEVSDSEASDSVEEGLDATPPTVEVSDDITESTTWTSDKRYEVISDGDLIMYADLTIEPGTEVVFSEDSGLLIREEGSIQAEGTAEDRITMTGTEEDPGWWNGIRVSGGNGTFRHVTFRHVRGGEVRFSEEQSGAIVLNISGLSSSFDLTVENSVFTDSEGGGIVGNEVLNSSGQESIEVSGNEFGNLSGPALHLPFSRVGEASVKRDNAFASGSVIEVYGDNSVDPGTGTFTLPAHENAHYKVVNRGSDASGVNIRPTEDLNLTIEPGAEILFEEDEYLSVSGSANLTAEGTADAPIRMVGAGEDPAPGDWAGLAVQGTSEASLEHVEIRHGGSARASGGEYRANIRLTESLSDASGGSLTIENSTVANSSQHGISCEPVSSDDPSDQPFSAEVTNVEFIDIPGENVDGCN